MSEVFNEFADGDLDGEFFANFADEALLEGFARLDFAAGKFPEIREVVVGTALGDEKFAVVKNEGGGDVDRLAVLHEATIFGLQ